MQTQPQPQQQGSRWARPQLVNTSLPAREAPPLVPGTLASLTRQPNRGSVTTDSSVTIGSNVTIDSSVTTGNGRRSEPYRRPGSRTTPAVSSEDEFPTLGGLRSALPKKEPTRSFAELSREWVKTAKEQEEAEKARREEEQSQQTPEEVFRHRVISLTPLNATASTATASSTVSRKEYDGIGGSKEEWSDESDLSDPHVDTEVLSPSDEDSEEFNSNIVWDRRSKNDMY